MVSTVRPFLVFCLLIPSLSLAQEFGPIPTRNHRATSLAFLRFEPQPTLTPAGQRRWQISIASGNVSRINTSGIKVAEEDYEVERLALHYSQGIRPGLDWSVEIPFLSRGGGFQDSIIEWWHRSVLHWMDAYRDSVPRNRHVLRLPGKSFNDSVSGLGDISLMIRKAMLPNLSLTVGLKAPTGAPSKLLGSGGFDAGIYVQWQGMLARNLHFHVQAGAVLQGPAPKLTVERPWVHQEGVGLVWSPNSRDGWIAQWQGEASALRTGISDSDATHRLITIGYERKLSERQRLDLYFGEDRDLFNGSFPVGASFGPDFTMGIRLNGRF
jgi:hypothetical protein